MGTPLLYFDMHTIRQDNPFESLKNRFLAAVYSGSGPECRTVYERILETANSRFPAIPENDEKILRQIQVAFRKLDAGSAAPVMGERYRELQAILLDLVKTQFASVRLVPFDLWKQRLNLHPWQTDRLFETAITCQLTTGCSNFCRRCNEWALPKVRSHFSAQGAARLLERLISRSNTDPALYGASDPLDWEADGRTLPDLLEPVKTRTCFSLLTKLPRGRQTVLRRLTGAGIPLSVSVTARNRDRIAGFETCSQARLQKQHDSDDLMIPAGLDEDFRTVKPSITDSYGTEITPDGAFIILPTFTSALYPMGHKKIPVHRDTAWFPVKKIGREALLVDYFKPLAVRGKDPRPYHLETLLDVQVENIILDKGDDALTPPGMRSMREYFEIFEKPARLKRKQMTRSVIRRIRADCLGNRRYRDLSPDEQYHYRSRIRAHLDFCRKGPVRKAALAAVAFLLAAVRSYLDRHPVKRQILTFLLGDEPDCLARKYGPDADRLSVEAMFTAHPQTTWGLFRFYTTAITAGRYLDRVGSFIRNRPARFDPLSDRFVPR